MLGSWRLRRPRSGQRGGGGGGGAYATPTTATTNAAAATDDHAAPPFGCSECLPGGEGGGWESALVRWRPNPSNGAAAALENERGRDDDNDDDGGGGGGRGRGGDFGPRPSSKACGHNEATMFFLRPHAGLEVLNSRVCSLASPAPGNDGGKHEGCLEFLRRACAASGRGTAFWDTECLAYVDGEAVAAARAEREREGKGEGGQGM